ncbi:4'-phosphopantetheinyl transferase family protein [Pseudoalteromonas luteoviolacea]|uniref:4'-phosphopantetheinyl transferase domain-containing protein n=1 Tax=Pseudoalteromonas luteoviolacea NCIMB 1942 TaxID=1365253 RepID=A0A166Y8S9_9GAMM|nr:4'-phosphopantetheinyl transferase superfamily protein [Pseudoalteromonas luteoviolacea]KZN41564.1 hypothetical protein N482_20010 [Pseudoalteromonas luteoviolacea NCIMB 1942]KZX00223.1 hypothetical protein JL49_12830 [Pseudoalteromonas luteoviolacea]
MYKSKIAIPPQQACVYVFKELAIAKGVGKKTLAVLLNYLYPQKILRVKTNKSGKPYIVGEDGCASHLYVSISHSKSTLVILLAHIECGIDIEFLRYPEKMLSVYTWITHPKDRVENLTAKVFLRSWTLKEAWLKLKSLGLEFGLENIRVDGIDCFHGHQAIEINKEFLYAQFFSVTQLDQTCVVSEEPLTLRQIAMRLETQTGLAMPALSAK